jgi:hypothetical protein
VQRAQHASDDNVGPSEERLMPGDVVDVNHGDAVVALRDDFGQTGLVGNSFQHRLSSQRMSGTTFRRRDRTPAGSSDRIPQAKSTCFRHPHVSICVKG